ncbi:hypothetical protein THSYN_10925 [Candidatus Thiodictyon syntrophicum]|uniref:Uncharacterized protein n=1 Tax=Candidatus Thiodictyon syntrophicum TaxID=1166950 RepID=A0A2K8U793_9GAMM|nr:hypothetical protein THSYN_10925 [Candidatus Thiodictyon syntrophicum]
MRRGRWSTRIAGVICGIAPHWGAALPGRAGLEVRLDLMAVVGYQARQDYLLADQSAPSGPGTQ